MNNTETNTRKFKNHSPGVNALQARDQAEAPVAAAQLAQVLRTSVRVVRTVNGADGKPIREIRFSGNLEGLFYELPPNEGSCHERGTVLKKSYVIPCQKPSRRVAVAARPSSKSAMQHKQQQQKQ